MASSEPNADVSTPVSFPQPEGIDDANASTTHPELPQTRRRTSTNVSTTTSRIRAASIKFMEASPPPGMWAAAGSTVSKAPSLADIRTGSFGPEGWNEETQRTRAGSRTGEGEPVSTVETGRSFGLRRWISTTKAMNTEPFPALAEEETPQITRSRGQDRDLVAGADAKRSLGVADMPEGNASRPPKRTLSGHYANGYVPPPKLPWKRSLAIGLKGFWTWFLTPMGFLITVYGLNVVAWGGMLFLLLCNAAPAMCVPNCNDIHSPRRRWIEVDSQVLNALFCVTGFGLAPWRFRDVYWWGYWRLGGSQRKEIGIRRLAGIHRGWFRLAGSDQLPDEADASSVNPDDSAVPIPVMAIPDPPPTSIRAPPTKLWKMDFVVWNNAFNTFFQVVLCFFMYHYNRFNRPSWATGTFVALGCIVAGVAGLMMWHDGKDIKNIEGVPMRRDYEDISADAEAQPIQNMSALPRGTTEKT